MAMRERRPRVRLRREGEIAPGLFVDRGNFRVCRLWRPAAPRRDPAVCGRGMERPCAGAGTLAKGRPAAHAKKIAAPRVVRRPGLIYNTAAKAAPGQAGRADGRRGDLQTVRVEVSQLAPNPRNPRRGFAEGEIRALAASIARYGLLSPLAVRRVEGGYELIAGERRLRALRLLGWKSAPCVLLEADDLESRLLSLIENIQREDLHYLDEAEACRAILREHGLTQEELARRLGRSPSAIANRLRLLKLPGEVRAFLRETPSLSERHARALLKLPDAARQLEAARRAGREGMSVRRLEALVEQLARQEPAHPQPRVTRLFRDGRMFVNAVLNTVRELNALGVPAVSRVTRLPGRIEVTVTLPENVRPAPEQERAGAPCGR